MYLKIKLLSILLIPISFFLVSCETKEGKQETAKNRLKKDSITNEKLWNSYIEWLDKQSFVQFEHEKNIISDFEKNRDTVAINLFIQHYYDSLKLFPEANITRESKNELSAFLYTIDFNGDNQLDMIYQGRSGGAPQITQIFLNKEHQYKKVFHGYQTVTEMQFIENKLTSFTLQSIGCCTDPQVIKYFYSVTYNDNIPKFVLVKAEGYLDGTELVKNKFPAPKPLEIKENNVKLRSNTYIIDVMHPADDYEGNILARYAKGAKGIAIGSKIDKENKWVYVKMLSKPSFCDWTTFTEQPTELYGWVLEETIKIE